MTDAPSPAQAVRELLAILSGDEAPAGASDSVIDVLNLPGKCFGMMGQRGLAPGAPEAGISLQPSDLLLHLLRTARAHDWEGIRVIHQLALADQRADVDSHDSPIPSPEMISAGVDELDYWGADYPWFAVKKIYIAMHAVQISQERRASKLARSLATRLRKSSTKS